MILPPSIIKKEILVDKPDNYGCYMYNFIDTKHELKSFYLGIKKDKLPDDGGKFYWGSSENEEFNKLIQGNEPRLILEIIDFRKREDFNYLQLKEYRMLQEYPDIKNNPETYNLSYGIPPIGKNGLPTEEFFDWFKKERKSGVWDGKTEKVNHLVKIDALQIRDADNSSFVKDISAELDEIGGNPKDMNSVLIFEGVGGKFGFEEGSDVVAGTTHGLKAAKKSKVIEMKVTRVPYDILKDKSEYFIRALAGNDNYDEDPLDYKPNYKDGAKLLVKLYNEHTISPESDIAKEQLKITYNLKSRSIGEAIKKANTDIEMNKKGDTKWKNWKDDFPEELKSIVQKAISNKRLAISMTSGMYDYRKILSPLANDKEQRKEMTVFIHHPNISAQEMWDEKNSDYKKELKKICPQWKITFKELDTEVEDTSSKKEVA